MELVWIKHDTGNDKCPVDDEQPVEVRWVHCEGTTKNRAGAFNWDMITEYRLMPKPAWAQ